jgi:DNA-binding YbaB/EbfC family protein
MRGGMNELLRQAQVMQNKIAKLQEELATRTVTANSGGGMVTVTANGKQEIVSIKIEKQVIDPNEAEMLEDLVVAAVNSAVKASQDMVNQEMSKVTGGMGIPGMF